MGVPGKLREDGNESGKKIAAGYSRARRMLVVTGREKILAAQERERPGTCLDTKKYSLVKTFCHCLHFLQAPALRQIMSN